MTDRLSLLRQLEAVLLAAQAPMSLDQLLALFHENERPQRAEMRQALAQLAEECKGRSLELVESAGGFRYRIRADYAAWVGRLKEERPPRYSRALLETLALIAYRQPITRGEIEEVRGVAVGSQLIRTLEEREWVKVVGHREVPGRPALYATTRQFLDYFHLGSLNDLPPLDEIRHLGELHAAEEWRDELDAIPVSPLLQQVDTEEDVTDDPAVDELLDQPLPEISNLTFADLAQRFESTPAADAVSDADSPGDEDV